MCGDGDIECGQVPPPPSGMSYVSADTGGHHAVLLRSDGQVIAFGHNGDGRCNVLTCKPGTWYTAVAAGLRHALLIRSDGSAVAFGCNDLPAGHLQRCAGPCDVPRLPPGLSYTKSIERDSYTSAGADAQRAALSPTAPTMEPRFGKRRGNFKFSSPGLSWSSWNVVHR